MLFGSNDLYLLCSAQAIIEFANRRESLAVPGRIIRFLRNACKGRPSRFDIGRETQRQGRDGPSARLWASPWPPPGAMERARWIISFRSLTSRDCLAFQKQRFGGWFPAKRQNFHNQSASLGAGPRDGSRAKFRRGGTRNHERRCAWNHGPQGRAGRC